MGTKRERLLQKLNPMLLKMTPKLSGDTGSFIDLDSDCSLEDGAKKLRMRFFRNQNLCEKNKRNHIQNSTEVTISSAKYDENEDICELITESLSLPLTKNDEADVYEKPGRRLQKLKVELQEKMSAKWEEEYKKRINESKSFSRKNEEIKKLDHYGDKTCDSMDEDFDEVENDCGEESEVAEDCDDGDEADDESEEEGKKSDISPVCGNGGNDEDSDFDGIKGKTSENDVECDEEACSLIPAYQPGGGLLYGGSELTQNEEELPENLMSPSLRLSMSELLGSTVLSQGFNDKTPKKDSIIHENSNNIVTEKHKLFSQNPNNSFDLSDAFEFCSGKFPDNPGTQNSNKEDLEATVDFDDEVENENEEYKECEETEKDYEVQNSLDENSYESPKNFPKIRKNIVMFEDSEEEEEKEVEKNVEDEGHNEADKGDSSALKLLSDDEDETAVGSKDDAKTEKKHRRILYFSDEEDEATDEIDSSVSSNARHRGSEDEEEEDARSVHYDSEENEIINPKEFFEKEAELSGSEWSGDEDERGLDEFDVEEGDADQLDSNQVRSQLEKIHIRRVLDDDAREVRLIQEILFEDGDLHSDGKRRDRKFKWKNLGTFEEQKNNGEEKEGSNDSEDDGAEEDRQRKLRYEKEMFLMAKKKSGEESSDDEMIPNVQMINVSRVKTTANADRKIDKVKAMMEYSVQSSTSSFISNARGSFLKRDEEFLSRLAKATAAVSDNVLGAKHSGNFIFASKSPEKVNAERKTTCKRQVEDAESCGRQQKKIKVLPEVDTGPSILDLLV